MYVIVETGGKQYRLEPQAEVEIEKLTGSTGDQVVLDRVLLVSNEGQVTAGTPYVEGARVVCRLLAHGRGEKLDVFTYKAKKNERRKIGHRQSFTRVKVEEIVTAA